MKKLIILFVYIIFSFNFSNAQLTLIKNVRITNSVIPTGTCNNSVVSFTANSNNITPTSYQWYKNEIAISGANSSTFSITTLNSDVIKVSAVESGTTYSFSLPMSQAYNCVVSKNGNLISNTNTSILTHHGQINNGAGVTDKGKIITVTSTNVQSGLILDLDFRNTNSRSTSDPTVWYDLTSNHNDAKLYSNVSWYSDENGGALSFRGTTYLDGNNADYVKVPNGVYFTGGSFTIQSWIYMKQNDNWNRVIDFGISAYNHCVLLTNNYNNTGHPGFSIEGGLNGNQYGCSQDISLNQWHLVCATFSYTSGNSTGVGKIYIDGSLATGGTQNLLPPTNINRTRCYIGRSNWFDSAEHDPDFKGGIGSVQIYNRDLSDTEIASNYNNAKALYGR